MTFTILGAPRTKKNHGRRIKRGRRIFHVPSEAHEAWAGPAVLQIRQQWRRITVDGGPCMMQVNVRALFYRDANRGDAVGYYQALADALEAAGVVEDDKLCVSWDGSRLLVDRVRPRIEVTLSPAFDHMDLDAPPLSLILKQGL